ncbi:type I restriction endonuclease subunit R [Luteibacter pinisoli]|uniref:Type I restriction enzyme endonuclease subunit n=1 Tax=Luteibacter pinisoli TaxID=2589080 RepID=A0A4Y5Z9Y2_9GAMM|nr:type I restriction endonuclease subunit R [Luteibacter pinisoli]QDE40928.1 type I restriction endonuclease subunit R [Luteibacter pinisoli]
MTVVESHIEHELIERLVDLKYTHRPDIRDRLGLEKNFREKFEDLNRVRLTDGEFQRLLDSITTPDVFAAAQSLRNINAFERDDGTPLNYTLVNIRDWCKNIFEVISQLRVNTDHSHHRYDLIILINGVPVAQIELKNLKVSPRRAMQQIIDYKNDAGNGYSRTLLCFVQLYIVSNRTHTWYFANNNERHFEFNADERFLPAYEFAREDNSKVTRLDHFAETFLAKCALGELISRYMVLVASEQKLLIMRPYQMYAVKAILDCIKQRCGNGYVWHTTGSGKTLTSFRASTLLKDDPTVAKCLFVVDRKDLDRQTREEFNRFQEGCVEENTNTEALVRRLLSEDYADKVIVTTIQKLSLALSGTSKKKYGERLSRMKKSRMVFIFDECHRSQFGENHKSIKEFFTNAQLFGFTGTPIFEQNASSQQISGQEASLRTTKDLFHRCLHQYTITHAIEDRNVLKFHVDYFKPAGTTVPAGSGGVPKKKIVDAIIEKHDSATNARRFNAILATSSINDAIAYYELFKEVQSRREESAEIPRKLNIACVFSPPAEGNRDVLQIQEDLPQEREDNSQEPELKKAALNAILNDYNEAYGTAHSLGEFDSYLQDVQKRIKDQQFLGSGFSHADNIDITIVVDMLLTGFDSKYLNTLYVDKKLRHHGLIQAFSRTNRVLNDSKPYGNILDFRQQESAVEDAITLFSGEKNDSAREIWLVESAPAVIAAFEEAVGHLAIFMESQGLRCVPDDVANLHGDTARSQFISVFKEVQRLATRLEQYTDLTSEQKSQIQDIANSERLHEFRSAYIETAHRLGEARSHRESQGDEELQSLDFELVLFASSIIDYDYIMSLISRMTLQAPGKLTLDRHQLISLIQSDAKFIDERNEIAEYIRSLPVGRALGESEIRADYQRFKDRKKDEAIEDLAIKHQLEPGRVHTFVEEILRRHIFDGEALSDLMVPLGLAWKARIQKELAFMHDLTPLLERLSPGHDISGLDVYEH